MIALWSVSQPRRPTMDASNPSSSNAGPARQAWNKGKLTGPKPPLRLGHVWSIRARLQLERRTRDLALFNLAIDSKLRGCDLVAVRVDDVAPNGYAIDRATVRQRKTGRPVRFELTEVTRQAVDDYLRACGLMPGQCLFPGHFGPDRPLTTRQYARLDCMSLAQMRRLTLDVASRDARMGRAEPHTRRASRGAS